MDLEQNLMNHEKFKSKLSVQFCPSISISDGSAASLSSNESEQFEIRWSRMNLLSKGSRLPDFITSSLPYKLINGSEYSNIDGGARWRPILKNISGSVQSGQLTAILGPSGVGKTSLLNSLTGRMGNLKGSGRVSLVGGHPSKRLSVVIVPQADVLPDRLTVIEDLQFTSRLKNPDNNFNHEQNIARVAKHLQMEGFLNTRIGKLSGGEARRLSIGRELLGKPNVLILDEPTSCLDANTCKKVIGALRDIAEHSETYLGHPLSIIVTIHQPQREVLDLFHRCYVMAQGGRTIYEGSPSNMLAHLLTHSSLATACDTSDLNENPAVVAIEVASAEYGADIISQLATHHETQFAADPANTNHSRQDEMRVDKRLSQGHIYEGNFVSQTLTLIERSWMLVFRNKFLLAVHIISYLLVGFLTVVVYKGSIDADEHACPVYRSEVDNVKEYFEPIRDRLGNLLTVLNQSNNNFTLFYQLVLIIANVAVALAASIFPQQMQMFIREHRNGWYSPASFLVSQTLAELPIDLIGPVLVVATSYSACNQPESIYHWRQLCFLLVLFITTLICKGQAQIVSALLMDSVQMSVFASCVLIAPFFVQSGLVIGIRSMMWPFAHFSQGSYLKYTFESFAMIRYGYGMCPCDESAVYGYPVQLEASALPRHLDRLAQEVLDDYQARRMQINDTTTSATLVVPDILNENQPNIILKMLRLVTDASNMFVPELEQLGDCDGYRSLVLMDKGIKDGVLPEWIAIMLVIFLIFKLQAYCMIKMAIVLHK